MKYSTRAEDWHYAGEGGAHVLFGYCPPTGESTNDGPPRGYLLRLVKQELAHCLISSAVNKSDSLDIYITTANAAVTSEFKTEQKACPLEYLENVVAPCLQSYLDVPQLACVNPALARALYQQAQDSGEIPSHRRASWRLPHEKNDKCRAKTHDSNATFLQGLWLRDYRQSPTESLSTIPRLTVEIKPKAAYTAVSPLVEPARRVKYHQCRYQWLHGATSSYRPLDLCSQSTPHIQRALQALVDEPRNNLRVWLGHTPCTDRLAHVLPRRWVAGTTVAHFTNILAHILAQEHGFLRRIQSLQKLDVIDSDGAVLIYNHLVHQWLHDFSREEASRLLDSCGKGVSDKDSANLPRKGLHNRLRECPYALLHNLKETSPALNEYLDLVVQIEGVNLLNDCTESYLGNMRQAALKLVMNMNRDDCLVLLRMWLLSLAMCDLSFFVGIQVESLHEVSTVSRDNSERKQTKSSPGVLLYTLDSKTLRIEYEIKAIDCDQKPAKKLNTRQQKEDGIFAKLKL